MVGQRAGDSRLCGGYAGNAFRRQRPAPTCLGLGRTVLIHLVFVVVIIVVVVIIIIIIVVVVIIRWTPAAEGGVSAEAEAPAKEAAQR